MIRGVEKPMAASIPELARWTGVSESLLYSLANEGKLPGCRRLSTRFVVHVETFENWLKSGNGEERKYQWSTDDLKSLGTTRNIPLYHKLDCWTRWTYSHLPRPLASLGTTGSGFSPRRRPSLARVLLESALGLARQKQVVAGPESEEKRPRPVNKGLALEPWTATRSISSITDSSRPGRTAHHPR